MGNFFSFSFFLVFLFGWFSAFFFRKQLLFSLLSLEFLVLSLFMLYISVIGCVGGGFSFIFYLLVMGACEATLGLSLLVCLVRLLGSDMLGKFGFIKC